MSVEPLLLGSRDKLFAALELLFVRTDTHRRFDVAIPCTPREIGPFGALYDRYLPGSESSRQFLLAPGNVRTRLCRPIRFAAF